MEAVFCPLCKTKLKEDRTNKFYQDGRVICNKCNKSFRITIDKLQDAY